MSAISQTGRDAQGRCASSVSVNKRHTLEHSLSAGWRARALRLRKCLLLTGVSLAGCTDGRTDSLEVSQLQPTPQLASAEVVIRDSAGVRIAENVGSQWGISGEGWWVADTPSVHIGVVEGEADYRFSQINALWRRSDGSIVVADGRASQIRTYGPDGLLDSRFGRSGRGPGELEYVSFAAAYRGDSIVVWSGRRVSVFDWQGNFGRSWEISFPAPLRGGEGPRLYVRPAGVRGVFADGSFVVSAEAATRGGPGQILNLPMIYYRYSPEGALTDTLANVAGVDAQVPPPGAGPLGVETPFWRQFHVAVDGNELLLGISPDFEVERRSRGGRILELIRMLNVDLTVTNEDRERFKDYYRQTSAGRAGPAEIERVLDLVWFPPVKPPYAQLLVDSERNLWARHFKELGVTGHETWSVFLPTGQFLGWVRTPEGLLVRDIGADYLLGVWVDSFDVQHVRLYSLYRNANSSPR